MVNYSWKASPNRWGRPEFNTTFSIGFENGLVSEQEGEESGTHRGAKDGSRGKRPRDVEGDTKQFLGI